MQKRFEKVEGGLSVVRVYEEYASAAERRKATRGVRRGEVTGKARSFLLVDHRREMAQTWDTLSAVGVLNTGYEPGDKPGPMCLTNVSHSYLNDGKVRNVGWRYVPDEWKQALLDYGWFEVINGKLYNCIED